MRLLPSFFFFVSLYLLLISCVCAYIVPLFSHLSPTHPPTHLFFLPPTHPIYIPTQHTPPSSLPPTHPPPNQQQENELPLSHRFI